MAYTKNVWIDQNVQRPKTYEVTNNADGSVTLTDSFGVVTEIGTPVNAVNMNHIEDGIADNDTAITTINGKIPSNATSSNKMAVASDIAAINTALTLKADKTQLHALKGYLEAGELLTDSEGLADVKSYAHSTFDLSKFTVVGSPTITDDGIASGFSTSNCLTIDTSTIDWTKPYKIKIKCNTGNIIAENGNLTCHNMPIIRITNRYLQFSPSTTFSNITPVGFIADNVTVLNDTDYYIIVTFDGTTYKFEKSLDDKNYTLIGTSTTIVTDLSTGGTSTIGTGYGVANDEPRVWSGSIDLKQFSITVDGVEVFSGNKTGIDTVKANDYTVVGSPTISDDGIASGFSTSNYLATSTIDFSNANSWVIYSQKFSLSELTQLNSIICNKTNTAGNDGIQVFIRSSGATSWCVQSTLGTMLFKRDANTNIQINTNYQIKIEFTGSAYNFYLSTNDSSFVLIDTYSSTTKASLNISLSIGRGLDVYWGGNPIDLNSFKIYVDGVLVYQPCLKIPYTLSKTGSKVVNSIYRDRVNDMAEQFGFAPYYTLSDSNFTLPQGELYGLIGHKADTDLSNINPTQTAKNTILGWGMPDYANAISVTSQPYQAPSDGYIVGYAQVSGTAYSYINNVAIAEEYADRINIQMIMAKGDTYTDNASSRTLTFLPLKGV